MSTGFRGLPRERAGGERPRTPGEDGPRRTGLLAPAAAVGLALLGMWLLLPDQDGGSNAAAPSAVRAAEDPASVPSRPAAETSGSGSQPPSAGASATPPSEHDGAALAPPGEGPAGDRALRRELARLSPPDLAPAVEEELAGRARRVLMDDTAAVYRQVRVQAALARRDGADERAVVHLVWAGSGPDGEFREGRTTTVRYEEKGKGSWVRAER
ncbi:hypothetical protein ABZ694_27570 [Streptomyces albidoflavus]|uniref:hypothetical protein n=1 Tax=Streptomyces albidoflavus TaxID=1886 RepID=UPI0033E4BDF0